MRHQYGTLPIRRWLALALAVTFLVPAFTTVTVAGLQFGASWHSGGEAAQSLRAGASHWTDPAWQAATRGRLARQGVDFVLFEGGHEVYRSSADPVAGTDPNRQRTVQLLVISGSKPQKMAYIYSNSVGWGGAGGAFWLIPVVGLATLLLTLSAIAWFLGRTLLTPLAATSSAARQIAAADLDVQLPDSRIREVAELKSAFVAMSAELRASLRHQANLEEERRLFISAVAHDLRTPLFSLRGYLEGLEQGLATTPQKMEQYIRVCREKANVLERLISDLFAFTRIEYLEQTVHRGPLELESLLSKAVEGRRREAEAKGVTLRLDGPPGACMLHGDEHLLGRAVENLLDNALRYTPAGGTVEVRWGPEGDRATFTITDTGPGIAPRDLPHLFEPMYRGDPSRSRDTGGTGLGLAIARRILRAQGGDLVAPNQPAGGAEFTGSLPLPDRALSTTPVGADRTSNVASSAAGPT
jgi:signal transduction histidine kinase